MISVRKFRYDMSEVDFRAECGRFKKIFPDLPSIKMIDAVGVYDAEFGSLKLDSNRLTKGLIYLAMSGCIIDPEFQIRQYNFLDKKDYLASEILPADMTFVSYILADKPLGRAFVGHEYRPEEMDELKKEFFNSSNPCLLDRNLGGVFSDLHSHSAWLERVSKSGSKIIYTHGGEHEIGTRLFKGVYDTVIATPLKDKNVNHDNESVKDIYDEDLDVPLAWTGFAADRRYLQTILPSLSTASTSFAVNARRIAYPHTNLEVNRAFKAA